MKNKIKTNSIIYSCEMGCTWEDLQAMFTSKQLEKFNEWMVGQTRCICDGRFYNHDKKQYSEACGGVAHGVISYRWDVERFIEGLPVID